MQQGTVGDNCYEQDDVTVNFPDRWFLREIHTVLGIRRGVGSVPGMLAVNPGLY